MRFFRDFLNNLPLKYKLIGIIAPTLIALLYYSAISIMERSAALNEMTHFSKLRDLAFNISETVHELQKERGLSVGFLASQGGDLRPELEAQRVATDKKFEALRKAMESADDKSLEEQLKILIERIDDLKNKRSQISALSMDSLDVIEVYSGIHRASFDVIGGMPGLINDGELSNRVLGYYLLQLYKELLGLERATLNIVFATDKLTPALERDLADLTQKQNYLQSMYLTVMSKSDGELFYDFLGDPVAKDAKTIKTAAFQRAGAGGGFGQDPKEWSKAQTEKINLLFSKLIIGHLQKEMTRITETRSAESKAALRNTWIITISAMLMTLAVSLSIARALAKSVNETLGVVSSIAGGDFTQKVPVSSRDEIGALGNSVNTMVGELRGMFVEIGQNSKTLAASAEEMSAVSTQLASGSEEMTAQSSGVASATEQLSANINAMAAGAEESSANSATVASTAEQMSANMSSIASAIEEMSITIKDIAGNSQQTSKVANDALGLSKTASETMQTLGVAANEIGKVTEMIKRIAEQTNLLALNATIEAASAGEAGRGFAVVANEIKQLANQSAQAAEEIAAKIEGVQNSSNGAVRVITDISQIIGKINESVGGITNVVNQQMIAANEISKNVSEVTAGANSIASSIAEVAKGAGETARNAGEAARGTNEISSNIQGISKAVGDNNNGIQQINASSGELAKIAGNMEMMISRFKVENDGHSSRREIVLRENAG